MIRNEDYFNAMLPAGFDGVFDWDFIQWRGKIKPMDIDAIVERKGHFIIFETKRLDNIEIPIGQKITLKTLHELKNFTIIILHGKSGDEISKIVAYPEGGKGMAIPFENAKQTIQELIDLWQAFAEGEIFDLGAAYKGLQK
jgi:hypothetical protein